jgi:uncharacterized protein YjbI with pentapeptide repeats
MHTDVRKHFVLFSAVVAGALLHIVNVMDARAHGPPTIALDGIALLKAGKPWDLSPSAGLGKVGEIDGKTLSQALLDLQVDGHKQRVTIRNGIVNGPVDLAKAQFDFDLEFEGITFRGNTDLRSSKFARGLTFSKQCQFFDRAEFQGMTVDGDLLIETAIFHHGVLLSKTKVDGILDADEIDCRGKSTFYNTIVTRSLFLQNAKFQNDVNFRDLRTGNDLDLSGAVMRGGVDLRYAAVEGTVFITDTTFPTVSDRVWIRGFSYRFLTNEPQTQGAIRELSDLQGSADGLIAFVEQADFSSDAYTNLSSYFKSIGNPGRADEVYILKRWRECQYTSWTGYLWNLFLYVTVGYGRRPWLAFMWGLGFVGLGCFVFGWRQNCMELVDASKPAVPRDYGCFWCLLYSLDVFVPAISLGAADIWRPALNRPWYINAYVRVQRVAGWILVPIGVAAIGGLIGSGS